MNLHRKFFTSAAVAAFAMSASAGVIKEHGYGPPDPCDLYSWDVAYWDWPDPNGIKIRTIWDTVLL
jgi:hypothetical protein